jgi:hypothetical protein
MEHASPVPPPAAPQLTPHRPRPRALAAGIAARFVRLTTARQAVVVGVLATVLLLIADALVRDESTPTGDDRIYELMAQHPGAPHTFPFAYRILLPDLVHVLPFGHTFSFSVLAWLCSGTAAGLLYVLMRRVDAPRWLAVGLALVFVLSPPLFIVSLRQGRNADAASILMMVAATLAIVDRRPRTLAAILFAGAFVRESALFMIPFAYAMWAQRPLDWPVLRRTALVGLPAVAAFVALRLTLPSVGTGYHGPLLQSRWDTFKTGLDTISLQARRMFAAFGPLWLVYPFALRRLRLAQAGLVLLGLSVLSMAFAGDWGRIVFLCAPVIFAGSAWVLRDRRRTAVAVIVLFAVLDVGYAAYMQRHGIAHGNNASRVWHPGDAGYPAQ